MEDVFRFYKRMELQEAYANCFADESASPGLRAKILLQELRTYKETGLVNSNQYRCGRYLFGDEKNDSLVYRLHAKGLVRLHRQNNRDSKDYIISITKKGERTSIEGKVLEFQGY